MTDRPTPERKRTVVYPGPQGPRVVPLEEAEALLRERLERETASEEKVKTAVALGGILEAMEDYSAAGDAYGTGLALEPADPELRYWLENNLGYCLGRTGSFREAAEHCRRAVALNPKRSNAHKNLGLALEGLARPRDAAGCYLRATSVDPRDPRSLVHLEQLLARHPELEADLESEIAAARGAVRSAQEQLRAALEDMGKLPRQ